MSHAPVHAGDAHVGQAYFLPGVGDPCICEGPTNETLHLPKGSDEARPLIAFRGSGFTEGRRFLLHPSTSIAVPR